VSVAAPPRPAVAATQPFLESRLAELLSLALFAAGGTWLAELFPLLVVHRGVMAVAATLLGAVGAGIERGEARRPGWGAAGALGLAAAALHVAVLFAVREAPPPSALEAALRGLVVALLVPPIVRFATRLDRREAGWRAAVRRGPPEGATSLGDALATRPLPLPLRALGWALLPLDLALRALALGAILGYQLTLSRLMPPACRYEPTCSRYGFQAFWHHGFPRAALLTSWRVLRCSPLGSGGYDPMVPAPGSRPTTATAGATSSGQDDHERPEATGAA
jgi:putative membrane protein insertion efficiency factor